MGKYRSKYRSIRRIAGIWILLIAVSGPVACYDSGFDSPTDSELQEPVNTTIADLKKQYVGTPFVIKTDIRVNGTVVSSDRGGNFYRSICIENQGAALEIMAGIDQLHNIYPVGCRVTVHLQGLTIAERLGVLQAGNAPEPGSGFNTDYLGSLAALNKVIVRNSEQIQIPLPFSCPIPDLNVKQCGTLVRIDRIRFCPDDNPATENPADTGPVPWSGYARFVDTLGNSIYSYVRNYADFAADPIPSGFVSLIGILQYDNSADGRFLLKLRDETDCLH